MTEKNSSSSPSGGLAGGMVRAMNVYVLSERWGYDGGGEILGIYDNLRAAKKSAHLHSPTLTQKGWIYDPREGTHKSGRPSRRMEIRRMPLQGTAGYFY